MTFVLKDQQGQDKKLGDFKFWWSWNIRTLHMTTPRKKAEQDLTTILEKFGNFFIRSL